MTTTNLTRGDRTINPVAKLGAAALIAVCLVLTIDPVSAGVALLLEIPLFAALGIGWRGFWRRIWRSCRRGIARSSKDR